MTLKASFPGFLPPVGRFRVRGDSEGGEGSPPPPLLLPDMLNEGGREGGAGGEERAPGEGEWVEKRRSKENKIGLEVSLADLL